MYLILIMNLTSDVSTFCEKRLYGNPEYLSSFSSLFISLFPIYSLKYSVIQSRIIINILLLLIITGITSFGYHWTGWYIFKHLDEIPMIISIWLGLLFSQKNISTYIFINTYMVSLLALNTYQPFQNLFPIFFAIPFSMLIPITLNKRHELSGSTYKTKLLGIILISLSAFIWIVSEVFCCAKLIWAHSLWHLGIAIGINNLLISAEYESLNNKKYKLYNKYYILPKIEGNLYSIS
mgnify:CR=1 FL=1